jgi:hypothetical protein
MSYTNTLENWSSPNQIEWDAIHNALTKYLKKVVSTFILNNPDEEIYGIVISHGQNWELSVYLNSDNNPDGILLDEKKRWYFDDWRFDLYEYECAPEIRVVNDAHYELFNRLCDDESTNISALSDNFLAASALAFIDLERSDVVSRMRRTNNFEIKFFDANSYEWETKTILDTARSKLQN